MSNNRKKIIDGKLSCSKCGVTKTLDNFLPRKERALGYHSQCQQCRTKSTINWRKKNKKRVNFSQRQCHIKNREQHLKSQRDYWRRNRGRLIAENKAWHEANPERSKELHDRHRRRNPGYDNIFSHNYRARKKFDGGKLSVDLPNLLLQEQNYQCPYCWVNLRESGYELDHYMPLSLGGAHADWNIQLTCPSCNKKKSNKHPIEFLASIVDMGGSY
jgi:5-methylcytosine-specific restriction endonuclease McrA